MRDFIDALREALGLSPLYAPDLPSPQFTLYESHANWGDDFNVWHRVGSAPDYKAGLDAQTSRSVKRRRVANLPNMLVPIVISGTRICAPWRLPRGGALLVPVRAGHPPGEPQAPQAAKHVASRAGRTMPRIASSLRLVSSEKA